jgi:hypothetical protein
MIFSTDILIPGCTTVTGFKHYLMYILTYHDTFLEFYGSLQWWWLHWKSHINQMKAYDEICWCVTGGDMQTVVAFRDGAFSSSSCGHPPGPVKTLYHELKRRLRGHVRLVNEFQTSIMCSGCDCDEWMDRPSRIWALKVCKNDTCLVSIFFHLPFLAPLSVFITIIWTYIYI